MTTCSPAWPNWPPNIDCAVRDGCFSSIDDDHTLAGGEPARLDDDGRALPAHPVGVEGFARERGVGGSGDAVTPEKFLGVGLGAFELRGPLARSEAAQAGGGEGVDHAHHQRPLGADDGEAHLFRLGECNEARNVVGRDVDVAYARFGGGAAVAGRHQHGGHPG